MKSLEWLYSLEGRGSVLGLDRVKELLSKLGNPQKDLKCIHIAGTNGKGSVCAIISSILRESGFKTGRYTSPHLKKFNERINLDGKDISDDELNSLIEKIEPFVTDQTFFEVTTALAFLYFKQQNVDFLVLEVGLGGRLDATNVIAPLLSIITNISLEHTQILGETEEEIAIEKAGIIKKGVPVITLAKGRALKTIKKIAKENNSPVYFPKRYHRLNGNFNVNSYKNLKLNLKGEFQMENTSIALKAIDLLKKDYKTTISSIRDGLKNTIWPGRFEFIEKNVLIDCAHNPAGVLTLKKEIKKIRKDYEKVITVTGMMKDKAKEEMVNGLASFSDHIIFSRPKIERAESPQILAKFTDKRNEIILDVKKALKKAKKLANPDDLIVVAGSIYLVGEV